MALVLTGKYLPGQAPGQLARQAQLTGAWSRTSSARSLAIAQALMQHAQARGVTLAQFATAWMLAHRSVSSVIADPRTLAPVAGLPAALDYGHTRGRGARRRAGRAG